MHLPESLELTRHENVAILTIVRPHNAGRGAKVDRLGAPA
jgi:hypothetical protein